MDKLQKASPVREAIYPRRQIILLAGCSAAEPASSSDLQVKDKETTSHFLSVHLKHLLLCSLYITYKSFSLPSAISS
jgi:hypothetical protein